MQKVQGKNILIVGATGGIGSETARLLKNSGANLFLTSTRYESHLVSLGENLGIPKNQLFQMDVRSFTEVKSVSDQIHSQIPHLDILINASGIGIIKPIESLSPEEFQDSIQINLVGSFHVIKAFIEPMKLNKKGLIVHLPGVLGKTPMAGATAYAASKYGLNGLLKSLREELKRTDIRITNLYLGGTDTPFWDTIDLKVQKDKFVSAADAAMSLWFLCQQVDSGVVSEMVLQPFNHQAI